MKIINWSLSQKADRPRIFSFLFLTPLLSTRGINKTFKHKQPVTFLVLKLFLSSSFLFSILFLAKFFIPTRTYLGILFICPTIYFATELLGALGQILSNNSRPIKAIHNNPLKSKSLGDFWGLRWNVWVQDWLRDISFSQRKHLPKKLALTFLVSGFFHELMVNLPYYLYFNKSYFGNMTLYFVIQGIGLWVEKKWLHNFSDIIKRSYTWFIIILPTPLFIARPLLTFFRITHE
jgi:hypothetical protein